MLDNYMKTAEPAIRLRKVEFLNPKWLGNQAFLRCNLSAITSNRYRFAAEQISTEDV